MDSVIETPGLCCGIPRKEHIIILTVGDEKLGF
jgi:hypothetical protein